MYKLAINGGKKTRNKPFPSRSLHNKEITLNKIEAVLKENKLSMFRGNWIQAFYGGEWIERLEKEFTDIFNCNHAISVNSATSGLIVACHAVGLGPGDEVIVTPWSMSCSATAPLACGATPVFADIEKDYFCLDPDSVREKITDKTQAIIVVDLFGQGYDPELNKIAEEHGLYIIEDAAQAIGGDVNGIYNGCRGDIGVFSFTQGKHISAGEGGMIVTDNDELAFKCQLVRNHADAVQGAMFQKDMEIPFPKLMGYNMRMTEINAIIAFYEMDEMLNEGIDNIIERSNKLSSRIEMVTEGLLQPGKVREKAKHVYYVIPLLYSGDIYRDTFINAVKAELSGEEGRPDKGVPIGSGYVMPLYRLPIFDYYQYDDLYNVSFLQYASLCLTTLQLLPLDDYDIDDIVSAFEKVYKNQEELM